MKKAFRLIKKICLAVMVIALCVFSFVASPTNPISSNNKVTLSADAWNSQLAEIDKIESQNLTKYISIKTLLTLDADELVVSVANPNTITSDTVIMLNDGLDVYYFSEICNPTFANNTENPYYKTYLTLNYTLGADINYEDASKTFFQIIKRNPNYYKAYLGLAMSLDKLEHYSEAIRYYKKFLGLKQFSTQ